MYLFHSIISISVKKSLFAVENKIFNRSVSLSQDFKVSGLVFMHVPFVNCTETLQVL